MRKLSGNLFREIHGWGNVNLASNIAKLLPTFVVAKKKFVSMPGQLQYDKLMIF